GGGARPRHRARQPRGGPRGGGGVGGAARRVRPTEPAAPEDGLQRRRRAVRGHGRAERAVRPRLGERGQGRGEPGPARAPRPRIPRPVSGVPDAFTALAACRARRASRPWWAAASSAVAAMAAAAGAGAALTALARELWRVRQEIGAPARRTGARFRNTEPATAFDPSALGAALRERCRRGVHGGPREAVPVVVPDFPDEPGELAATWLGHATVLLEVEGRRVLTDPVFGRRCSPSGRLGPRRLHRAPVDLAALPPIDAVVISHDHYDHLERATMLGLARDHDCRFVVPTGISAHLRRWGIAPERIVELGWGAGASVAGLEVTCCEVRHFSGRGLLRDRTQWAGWAVAGARRRVVFGGDSGYTRAFADAGSVHGPVDRAVLPSGAYWELWPHVPGA